MKPNLPESDIQPNGGSAPLAGGSDNPAPQKAGRRNTCLPLGMNRAFTLIELLACRPKLWRRQARSAFTLIELLVVISIIAILAALLLPTLNQAKNRAMTAVDLNNVHQILLATHLYCGDNDDIMPQPGWGGSGETYGVGKQPAWATGVGFPVGPTTAVAYPTLYQAEVNSFKKAPGYSRPAQLFQYIRNPKALRCPADIPGPQMYTREIVLTSYVFNGAVNGFPAPSIYGATYKLTRFKADAILLWENDELMGNWNDTANYPQEGISARHGQGATVGLFGGGALRMNLTDFYWLVAHQRTKWTGASGAAGAAAAFAAAGSKPNAIWCNPRPGSNGGP